MRYYVVADVHGFFSELNHALTEAGFYEDNLPHKLIICGDIFDRGSEALQLQEFLLNLLANDELILIKGNHEDLTLQLMNEWHNKSYLQPFHYKNGTIDTICQLTHSSIKDLPNNADVIKNEFLQSPFLTQIIPAMLDYFETQNYIFVHGWIPCTPIQPGTNSKEYVAIDYWRQADKKAWDNARWINGMEAAKSGIIEKGKTIVCGHWHCSFGHSNFEEDGGEFDHCPNFNPYYGDGIIALDACTSFSKKVNCIVIED